MQNPGDMHSSVQPTWANPQHAIDHNDATDIHRRRPGAHRSSTAPAASYGQQSTSAPAHPRSLVPGIAPTLAVRHDFFFSNQQSQPPPPPVPPLPPMHQASAVPSYSPPPPPPLVPPLPFQPPAPVSAQHFLPRPPPLPLPLHHINGNITSPPPIPPKPHLARHTSALPVLQTHQHPHIPIPHIQTQGIAQPSNTRADEEEDALATALALSQSESDERTAYMEALKEQEEEELARALQESLSMQDNHSYVYSSTIFATSQSSLTMTAASTSKVAGSDSAELNQSDAQRATDSQDTPLLMSSTDVGNDAKAKTPETDTPQPTSVRRDFHVDKHVSLEEDEAFARRLAAEEEAGAMLQPPSRAGEGLTTSPIAASPLNSTVALPGHSPLRVFRALPTLDSIVEHPVQKSKPTTPSPDSTSTTQSPIASPPPPTYNDFISSPSDPRPASVGLSPSSDLFDHSKIGRHNSNGSARSASTVSDVPSSPTVSDDAASHRPSSTESANMKGSRLSLRHRSSLSAIAQSDQDLSSATSPATSGVVNANQFVDRELLKGVSIGFTPPTLISEVAPMQGVMPNVISLPYGRSLPLHLQAPSWRQMLKLLARHSGSRLEPTVDAMALNRGDIRLRTVVQFLKPHQLSVQWRTILWLTLDHAIPPQHLAPKYTNGDVNALPYSYILSSIPTLLRDGSDTSISKIYTIPATNAVPYPALPITFPNFALYLQAALEESRRFMNDSSSGIRKLAKMMDSCYPASKEAPSDLADDHMDKNSGRVGGLFKRVIGRGNKAKKGRGNDDTYELVTPFVPDGWG